MVVFWVIAQLIPHSWLTIMVGLPFVIVSSWKLYEKGDQRASSLFLHVIDLAAVILGQETRPLEPS